jgi:hypothetical protein
VHYELEAGGHLHLHSCGKVVDKGVKIDGLILCSTTAEKKFQSVAVDIAAQPSPPTATNPPLRGTNYDLRAMLREAL